MANMNIASNLAPYAMDVRQTRGRRHIEPPHPYRNDYARDRDRVVHSRAFRRLEAKTQVFTTRFSDHFRNRLTHTLEVAQIARTVAGALGLNADLVEALALVHDIGHPPFGHAGERQLDLRMREHGDRFNHNLHALYIVEQFEQRYLDFSGLNLTFEVREGIIKHSRDYSAAEFPELVEYLLDQRPPLEAQLIDLVDEIAYNTADLDDGFEARLLQLDDLASAVPLFDEVYKDVDRRYPSGQKRLKFNEALKRVLDTLATDLIEHARSEVTAARVASVEDVRRQPKRLVSFSMGIAAKVMALKRFLSARLYENPAITEDRERSVAALDELFLFYLQHPEKMPAAYAEKTRREKPHRVVCEYIAGMTDHYLLQQHQEQIGSSKPLGANSLVPPSRNSR
ncbi:MAG TPA: deoxyguanosinetriphosphate triphosphohydrolase [Candidatus Acidoferrales bacterium]|nr:deoxyguanosinetriphosphate triphosphohydrolase [Candidatus Acidoferrales bacterium]